MSGKKRTIVAGAFLLSTFACSFFAGPAGNIELPALFTDNMVLQRDIPCPVWGKAEPGKMVTVEFAGQKKRARTNKEGNWKIKFSPLKAGVTGELVIAGKDTMRLKNVIAGDVWVGSGQSNMEMPLAGWGEVLNFREEIANANYPDLRLFRIEHATSVVPVDTIQRSYGWDVVTRETVPLFSSTAYFFGRHLVQNLDVPIGLLETCWGGTIIEAWTSGSSLKKLQEFAQIVQEMETNTDDYQAQIAKYSRKLAQWQASMDSLVAVHDKGESWQNTDVNAADWESMDLPILWEQAGLPGFDGVVWFRKTFILPEHWQNQELTVSLGPIDDIDITWVNGTQIGSEQVYNKDRVYTIPASAVRPGENVIAIRVVDTGGGGGIWGTAEQMYLLSATGEKKSLAGKWIYMESLSLKNIPPRPMSPEGPNRPMVLYNAMINPVIPFAIKGAIWYQGESNASRAFQYRTLFANMITDWRQTWGVGDFPFLFVQLANFQEANPIPVEDDWAELREAQTMALALPNTGMAVAIDIGDAQDIHPKNKQEVGKRLALNALKIAYNQDVVFSGPIYKSMQVEDNKIRISFDHVNGGLTTNDGDAVRGFAVAGADSQFVWANVEIDGDQVIVWNNKVSSPVAVRYAWSANPDANLCCKEGLPASPFRTDDWQGITFGKK